MMQDFLTLYKLIILYILSRVDFPLTKTQISDFMLEKEFTNSFLTIQQAMNQLIEDGYVTACPIRNRTQLSITPEGRETLKFFQNQINYGLREDIDAFLKENEFRLRDETSIWSDYTRVSSGEYEARLVAKDKGITLVDITLSVPLEETAAAICDNWHIKNQEIYQYLIGQLF